MANENKAGRPLKYGQKTVRIVKFVPASKLEEIENKIDTIIKEYETPKIK